MAHSASRPSRIDTIDKSVTINRLVDQVFSFYRDFRNLPKFLGDVMTIDLTGPTTSQWTIEGPLHVTTHWTTEVPEERTNSLIANQTVTSSRMTTRWEIYFSAGPHFGETLVREVMKVPFGEVGQIALDLIGKPPAEEIQANLLRLKKLFETGKVTNTQHAVAG